MINAGTARRNAGSAMTSWILAYDFRAMFETTGVLFFAKVEPLRRPARKGGDGMTLAIRFEDVASRLVQERHALGGVGDVFAHQVLAGDAQVRVPAIELGDDLGGGDERHLDAGDILDLAAIAAIVARLAQLQAGAGEKLARLLHEPPLGGYGKNERAHALPPTTARSRSQSQAAARAS